jgi:hypothetical protein
VRAKQVRQRHIDQRGKMSFEGLFVFSQIRHCHFYISTIIITSARLVNQLSRAFDI